MPEYTIYGGTLYSDIELPELPSIPGERGVSSNGGRVWSYRHNQGVPPAGRLTELGKEAIYGDVHARLFQREAGYRIVVDDTGTFDLTDHGATITGYPLEAAWPDFVRAHLLGRVLSTALHLQGIMTLHGSAVVLADQAVAFLAPKHHGKTTLALSLTQAGGTLLTDDTLPIDVGRGSAMAGVHSMRLQPDVGSRVAGGGQRSLTREGKEVFDHMPEAWKQRRETTLGAIYLLHPVTEFEHGGVVDRRPLSGAAAALGVVGHAKIGGMLGRWGSPTLLEQSARLTRDVPVYQLLLKRDLGALPAVVEQIGSWHGQQLAWGARQLEAP